MIFLLNEVIKMKYRLKIPEEWEKFLMPIIRYANGEEVGIMCVGDKYTVVSCVDKNMEPDEFPVKKDWLEPIEDGPVSIEDIVNKFYPYGSTAHIREKAIEIGKLCESNHAKRTQPVIDASKRAREFLRSGITVAQGKVFNALNDALKTLEETCKDDNS
jgi:hypothetical protein